MLHQRKIRGIVFDLDGVLIDSAGCHRAAFEEVLGPLGIGDFEYSHYAGWRTQEVIQTELARAGMAAEARLVARLAEQKTLLARVKLRESDPRKEGCPEILERLCGMGYALGLASSGSRGSVEGFLDDCDCRRFFRSVLTGGDVSEAKPDPEIYEKSFRALALAADECVVVEDAISGIEAARRAGAVSIGITGVCDAEELLAAGARVAVDKLLEIPDVLRTM